MPAVLRHRFVVDLCPVTDETQAVGQAAVPPDCWGPAIEWARFETLRLRPTNPAILPSTSPLIEPVWHTVLGEPYVGGFRVSFPEEEAVPAEFGTDYFKEFVRSAAAAAVEEGVLESGDTCAFLLSAFPREAGDQDEDEAQRPPRRFAVKRVAQAMDLPEAPLSARLAASTACGTIPLDKNAAHELPVFIPEHLLEELQELNLQAGAAETGGVLIGHLYLDSETREKLFLEVTAQIPAQHTKQELTQLTFTHETWASVDAAIRIRKSQERKLGWWHTHPSRHWCAKCPPENRAKCKVSGEFFSTQDSALQATVFPMAYGIGLVLSDSYAQGVTFPLFGWNQGRIVQRGFYRLGSST